MNNVEINPKEYSDNNWRDFEWAAQVAIEALREPTEEMIEAATNSLAKPRMRVSHAGSDRTAGACIAYSAMIDAALEQQKSPAA